MGDSFYQKKTPQKIEMSKNNISTRNEPGKNQIQYVRCHFYFLGKKRALEQFYAFQKKINKIAVEYSVFIIEIVRNIHSDDYFLEEIFRKQKRFQFCGDFFILAHAQS